MEATDNLTNEFRDLDNHFIVFSQSIRGAPTLPAATAPTTPVTHTTPITNITPVTHTAPAVLTAPAAPITPAARVGFAIFEDDDGVRNPFDETPTGRRGQVLVIREEEVRTLISLRCDTPPPGEERIKKPDFEGAGPDSPR